MSERWRYLQYLKISGFGQRLSGLENIFHYSSHTQLLILELFIHPKMIIMII